MKVTKVDNLHVILHDDSTNKESKRIILKYVDNRFTYLVEHNSDKVYTTGFDSIGYALVVYNKIGLKE